MSEKNTYKIGDAIDAFLTDAGMKEKYFSAKILSDWKDIAGPLIANSTNDITLYQGKLFIYTESGPLKNELFNQREVIKSQVNNFYKHNLVVDVIIK